MPSYPRGQPAATLQLHLKNHRKSMIMHTRCPCAASKCPPCGSDGPLVRILVDFRQSHIDCHRLSTLDFLVNAERDNFYPLPVNKVRRDN